MNSSAILPVPYSLRTRWLCTLRYTSQLLLIGQNVFKQEILKPTKIFINVVHKLFCVEGSGLVTTHHNVYFECCKIWNAEITCENVLYRRKIAFTLRGLKSARGECPEHLVLLSVFVSVHLIDIIVPHLHWSPFIYVLLSLRCSNNVWRKRTIAVI